ncbi:MAG: triose-phosphate isomerase [Gemmataceae bacterium]|nr:triose-phosphate isomerase [Gemmataceae bacterium]
MARQKFVAGNWKMFTSAASGRALARAVAAGVTDDRVRVAVAPPYPYLALIAECLAGSRVGVAAQNLYPAHEGAFTGEVSPEMLKDVGCKYVILGHSERRHGLGERNEFINLKVRAAIDAGLDVILCVGETLEEREKDHTQQIIWRQLYDALAGFDRALVHRLTIAYEPVWAIGTGRTATPDQAQEVHAYIRGLARKAWDEQSAAALTIQYGGSVKAENARELMSQPDIDGALVGGASLKPESFLAIVAGAA